MARLRVAVLISGRGSNMQALLAACAMPDFPAEIVAVISNRRDAAGLRLAEAAGARTAVVESRGRSREAFEAELDGALRQAGAGFVCLAGFMRLLTAPFVARWRDRMINIHPSLLPAFPGAHAHRNALAAGVSISGCTVHFVRAGTDDGPIVAQAAVPVAPGDSEETLAARVLQAEHRLYPAALRWIAEGRVRLEGERVMVAGVATDEGVLLNPLPSGEGASAASG